MIRRIRRNQSQSRRERPPLKNRTTGLKSTPLLIGMINKLKPILTRSIYPHTL